MYKTQLTIDSKQGQSFASRLVTNSVLFYLVVWLYQPNYLATLNGLWDTLVAFLIIGIIFSVLNEFVKPVLTILTLPAVFLSLGLFTLVINGMIIYLTAVFVPGLSIGFGTAIIGGIVMSLANYLITNLFEGKE